MAQQDHLLYFNIRARGEPTRMLYALAGKEFKDETTTFEEWVTTSSSRCSHYIVVSLKFNIHYHYINNYGVRLAFNASNKTVKFIFYNLC